METQNVTKQQHRQVVESEVLKSDRVELIQQANRLVESMVTKTTMPKIYRDFGADVELSESEDQTYQAALDFLRRQFQVGPSVPLAMTRRSEVDSTVERMPPPATTGN